MEVYAVYMYIIWYTCQSHNSMPPKKKQPPWRKTSKTRKLRWPPHSAASDGRSAVPTRAGPCKSDGKPNRQWPHQLRPLRALVDLTLQTPSWIPNKKVHRMWCVTTVGSTESWILNPGGQQWLNWKDAVGFSVSIYISDCCSFLSLGPHVTGTRSTTKSTSEFTASYWSTFLGAVPSGKCGPATGTVTLKIP